MVNVISTTTDSAAAGLPVVAPFRVLGSASSRWVSALTVAGLVLLWAVASARSWVPPLFLASRLIIMTPRPGRIAHEQRLDFNRAFLDGQPARQVKSSPAFIACREQALDWVAPPRVDVRSVPSRVHPLVPAAQLLVA